MEDWNLGVKEVEAGTGNLMGCQDDRRCLGCFGVHGLVGFALGVAKLRRGSVKYSLIFSKTNINKILVDQNYLQQ